MNLPRGAIAPRAGIGVVVPSVNTMIEEWYPYALPDEAALRTARALIGATVSRESLREMDAYGMEAARALATCRPNVIVYGCTASSLMGGRDYDLELMAKLEGATGVPVLTTTESAIRSFAAQDIHTLAVASPYADDVARQEQAFLEETGHTVLGESHMGISGAFELAAPGRDEILAVARQAWERASGAASGPPDGLFIGCMNFRSHLVIETLEAEFDAPVITATSATLWAALRAVGVTSPVPGGGRLFAAPQTGAGRVSHEG